MNKKSGTEIHACEILLFQYDQCLLKIYDLADINIIIIIVCYPPYWRKGLCGFINSFSWFSEMRWFTPHSNPDLDFFCVRFHYLSLSLKLAQRLLTPAFSHCYSTAKCITNGGDSDCMHHVMSPQAMLLSVRKHTSAVVRFVVDLTYLGPST